MPRLTVTRRLTFNAAHRIHNPALSDDENARLFGKCNSPNWHGHNYTLEVSVTGEPDPVSGYVIDLAELKQLVERALLNRVDHHNFNLDVPEMAGTNPTAENIILMFWRVLEPALMPRTLSRLKLWETENNWVEYDGR
jgi:6-pyruvoyltetrahydropterin/6-carboxytetrahydropterin synthase